MKPNTPKSNANKTKKKKERRRLVKSVKLLLRINDYRLVMSK